jgi:sugar phosphate isomerase/epimerase
MPQSLSTSVQWPIAVSEWTLREPTTTRALSRIATAGYECVEIGGRDLDAVKSRRALAESGLRVTSVCPILGPDRDFCADELTSRRAAADTVRGWIDFAGEVGAPVVIVVPSDRATAASDDPHDDLLQRCADELAAVVAEGDYTAPIVVIEPLNRYETHLVRTLADADRLRTMIGSPRVALMADLFHMNIEEDSIPESLRAHMTAIRHVHLADNQRREPGSGQLPLVQAFGALAGGGYQGTLAMEFLPATDEALVAARIQVERALSSVGELPAAGGGE